jgi:hypothetical protein
MQFTPATVMPDDPLRRKLGNENHHAARRRLAVHQSFRVNVALAVHSAGRAHQVRLRHGNRKVAILAALELA